MKLLEEISTLFILLRREKRELFAEQTLMGLEGGSPSFHLHFPVGDIEVFR